MLRERGQAEFGVLCGLSWLQLWKMLRATFCSDPEVPLHPGVLRAWRTLSSLGYEFDFPVALREPPCAKRSLKKFLYITGKGFVKLLVPRRSCEIATNETVTGTASLQWESFKGGFRHAFWAPCFRTPVKGAGLVVWAPLHSRESGSAQPTELPLTSWERSASGLTL